MKHSAKLLTSDLTILGHLLPFAEGEKFFILPFFKICQLFPLFGLNNFRIISIISLNESGQLKTVPHLVNWLVRTNNVINCKEQYLDPRAIFAIVLTMISLSRMEVATNLNKLVLYWFMVILRFLRKYFQLYFSIIR